MSEDIALSFLDQLYRDVDDGWLSLFYVDRGRRRTLPSGVEWASVADRYSLALYADELSREACVWLGVATRHEPLGARRGGVADCETLPALFVDIDVAGPGHKVTEGLPRSKDDAFDLLGACPLIPTCTVDTGGGLQAWWMLSEPIPCDGYARDLLARWGAAWHEAAAARGLRIDSVFNVDRVLRLPGTYNCKITGNPRAVTIKQASWYRWGLDDLEEWALAELPHSEQHVSARAEPYDGPERPGDAYNREYSTLWVLERAGFKVERSHGKEIHLTGPWKDSGTSATIYPDGHATIWSDSALPLWPALELRRPYDAFGLYAVFNHGGDHGAAARALNPSGSALDLSAIQENGAKVEDGEAEVKDSIFLDWRKFWSQDKTAAYAVPP